MLQLHQGDFDTRLDNIDATHIRMTNSIATNEQDMSDLQTQLNGLKNTYKEIHSRHTRAITEIHATKDIADATKVQLKLTELKEATITAQQAIDAAKSKRHQQTLNINNISKDVEKINTDQQTLAKQHSDALCAHHTQHQADQARIRELEGRTTDLEGRVTTMTQLNVQAAKAIETFTAL